MKYKLLILDVDGTILPYKKYTESHLPSKRVIDAIEKASEKIQVVLATGRPFFMLEEIFKALNMTDYAIINDGAQVVDIKSRKVLYHKQIAIEDVHKIMNILSKENIEYFINDDGADYKIAEGQNDYKPRHPLNVFSFHTLSEKEIDEIIDKLTHIPTIRATKSHFGEGDKWGLIISHAEATKLHGIFEVAKLLGIKQEEIIGVGDSGNDFQLLMASGLKVAMGNALPAIKDIADYIAPSVYEDGVADVIDKFILHPQKN
jgi:HAD superfamily hydrolase (TIGR01484 family)